MNALFDSSPYHNSAAEIGDYVMMESCIDHGDVTDSSPAADRSRRRKSRREKRRREFPPPLTVLAMTENQPPHMPFVMRRYTTADGRLVIVEEKVKHHDYFRVTRSEGRLVMELVAMDERERGESDEVEERECDSVGDVEERGNRDECCNVLERENMIRSGAQKGVVSGRGKCYDYMRVSSSPCLFGTVPTVRPVHI